MERETLLLIDGHALVFRAFFAMPRLVNSRGEVTNAVYGFTSMLLKVLSEYQPAYAVAAFDPPGPTFRHEEFKEYKAQRPRPDPELISQMPLCREVVAALGIPIVELPGYEADDVIGTLAGRADGEGLDVLILTGDLDALQLVNDHVRVYATRRGITETIVYDLERVRERYGFEPPLVADYKALQGDVTDNIPGVPGIGGKTAQQLIQEHGELESILSAVPQMKEGRVRRNLQEHAAQARLSKRMATIVRDLDVPFDLEGARLAGYDRQGALQLFEHLEFRSLVPRLPPQRGHPHGAASTPGLGAPGADGATAQPSLPLVAASRDTEVFVVRDRAAAEAAAQELRSGDGLAVRTLVEEPAWRGVVVGVALARLDDPARAWYLPLGHSEGENAAADAAAPLLALLADPAVTKAAHDVKHELLAWGPRGLRPAGFVIDLLLASYLANTRERVPRLTLLLSESCGLEVETEEALLGSGRAARRASQLGVDETAACLGRITALFGPVRGALDRALESMRMRSLHDDMELPLTPILAAMEATGIGLDHAALRSTGAELGRRIGELEAEIAAVAGYDFNIGSTQQLARFLYDELGLASGRRTKTGRSTDADTLESLRAEHSVVDLVLEWRQLTKLKGTYVDALPELVDADGRVHTSFNQAVATTGRLSSADPNLQNIPIRTEWGQRVRSAFIPEATGWSLVSADYSQIELRVLAHVTNDHDLVEAFLHHEDVHARTAAAVYGVAPAMVSPQMRRSAKVVNFGVLYGLSDFGLARDTGMSREEAAAFIAAYFRTFSSVAGYREQILNFAREWGYVETLFGRRRYLPDLLAANRSIRQAAERMAINMPIQGSAADIMKLAMIGAARQLRERGLRARLLLQVHDELVLEAPAEEIETLGALLREAMGNAAELIVPLDVEVKVGPNWSALRPFGAGAAVTV